MALKPTQTWTRIQTINPDLVDVGHPDPEKIKKIGIFCRNLN
jgi:hypothetical protein